MRDEPIYRKIMNQIEEMIDKNELPYGAKLPAERDMAARLGVPRGTIKKAYAELEKRGTIGTDWGSGAYVLRKNAPKDDLLNELSEAFFDTLLEVELTAKEAREYMDIKHSRKYKLGNVRILLIHTSLECLAALSKQLESIAGVKISGFVVDELTKFKQPHRILDEFDIILVTDETSPHIYSIAPELKERVLQINTETSKETQVDFLKIMNFEKSGLISASREFRDVVNDYVQTKGYRYGEKDHIIDQWTDRDAFDALAADKRHLVMPPIYAIELKAEVYEGLFEFLRGGGDVVIFNPIIDRGILLHIEERVMKILYGE